MLLRGFNRPPHCGDTNSLVAEGVIVVAEVVTDICYCMLLYILTFTWLTEKNHPFFDDDPICSYNGIFHHQDHVHHWFVLREVKPPYLALQIMVSFRCLKVFLQFFPSTNPYSYSWDFSLIFSIFSDLLLVSPWFPNWFPHSFAICSHSFPMSGRR